jgi:hypothetical protein
MTGSCTQFRSVTTHMAASRLQQPFLEELADTFRATSARITRPLAAAGASDSNAIIEHELRGLYHGLLVIFDGGTALADQGLVSIVDEDGAMFDRHLHEICFDVWPTDSP